MNDTEKKQVASVILNNVTIINRFRHRIETKIPECDERTQRYFEGMVTALNELCEYGNKVQK